MKKAVIFDNEWVIIKNDWDNVAKKVSELFNVPLETGKGYRQKLKSNSNDKNNPLYKWNRGKISKKKFWCGVLKNYSIPSTEKNINKMSSALEDLTTEVDHGVLKILNDLKNAGHPLYLLSNSTEEIEKGNKKRHDYFNLFDKVYMSFRIGFRKPDEGAYKIILNEQKLKPKECVFIDDKEKNLKGAEKIGIIPIKYNIGMPVQDLRTRLIKEGYKIPKS